MNQCRFCEKRAAPPPQLFDLPASKHFFYYWTDYPVTPGHLLVIPKRHVANFRELDEAELAELPHAILRGYERLEATDLSALYKKFLENPQDEKSRRYLEEMMSKLEAHPGKPDAYNHGVNDGEAAGRTVHHFHYHILPRWSGDTADPRGGVLHMFGESGNYLKD